VPVTVSTLAIFDVGSSIFFEAAYTDRNGNAATPTAVSIELIDVTNAQVLYPNTAIGTPTGPTQEIAVPGVGSVMTKPTQTQTNRLVVTATLPDGTTQVGDFSYQLNNPTLLSSVNPLQV
jgi:hypothetical protein